MTKQPKSLISLRTPKGELILPLGKAFWLIWCILTYPLQIAAGWWFFGTPGLLFVAIIVLLNFRGRVT